MIGTEFLNGQGLGNQLFCYISARCIALDRGCSFGTANQEQLAVNIHSGKGMYFMDLDLGERIVYAEDDASRSAVRGGDARLLAPDGTVLTPYHEKELRLYQGTSAHDLAHGCYIAGADEALLTAPGQPADDRAEPHGDASPGTPGQPAEDQAERQRGISPGAPGQQVRDNVVLYGNLQDERYFGAHRDEIRTWMRVKPEYDSFEYTRDNLCILNVRGGEYTGHPELYLRPRYWLDAMANMRRVREDMEFIISTDDPEAASKLLPGLPVLHRNLDQDYVILKNARYLILSNSSFAFFPAYTSETLRLAIAPKYWARHNVSDGYWASEQNIYSIFRYQDRAGKLCTPQQCRDELEQYKKTSAKYDSAGRPVSGSAAKLAAAEAKLRMSTYYGQRAVRSLRRRAGYRVPFAKK